MADLRKIDSIDGLSEDQFNAEPGQHIGLLILATGKNKTGKTGDFKDLGRIVITRNGIPLVNRKYKKFTDIDDIRAGSNIINSSDGADFEASIFVPFFEKGHPNALNIVDEKELNIRHIPGQTTATVFDSLEVEVQSKLALIPERYNFRILGEDMSYASQVTGKPVKLNQSNVSSIYIEDVDDIISDVQFESNERIVVSNNSLLALQADTNFNNRIEDPSFSVVEIENHTPGVPGSMINRTNVLRFSTSGAGNIDITVCSIDFLNSDGN